MGLKMVFVVLSLGDPSNILLRLLGEELFVCLLYAILLQYI